MLNALKIHFYHNIFTPSITLSHCRRCLCSVLHSLTTEPVKQTLCCDSFNLEHQRCNNNNILTRKLSHLACPCLAKNKATDKNRVASSDDKLEMASNVIDVDDEEIAIVGEFNAVQERAKKAIEIILDDDDGDENEVGADMVQVALPPGSENARNQIPNSETTSAQRPPAHVVPVPDPAEVAAARELLERYRPWELTNLGASMSQDAGLNKDVTFSFLSYNVLAQALLEQHAELYQRNDPRATRWQQRSRLLLQELAHINADVICLQEVQEDHLNSFYNRLNGLGYKGVYKQRTGGKRDGLAIYFRKSKFTLVEQSSVEFYQPGVQLLNRDNVALIVKLGLRCPGRARTLVVANTHLLYNPRREDVRLAQTQLLLAEIDRLAFIAEDRRSRRPLYGPLILAGDFNTWPGSETHRLLAESCLHYDGLPLGRGGTPLTRTLLPRQLEVTDTCQHFSVICRRPDTEPSDAQRSRLMVYHSEQNKWGSFRNYVDEMRQRGLVNGFTPRPHIEIPVHRRTLPPGRLPADAFCTGLLSHNLNLRSVYRNVGRGATDVTTFHDGWQTVDYIFYGGRYNVEQQCIVEGELKVVSRLRLPRAIEAEYIGPIPNMAAPSDHYPLAAVFTFR